MFTILEAGAITITRSHSSNIWRTYYVSEINICALHKIVFFI